MLCGLMDAVRGRDSSADKKASPIAVADGPLIYDYEQALDHYRRFVAKEKDHFRKAGSSAGV